MKNKKFDSIVIQKRISVYKDFTLLLTDMIDKYNPELDSMTNDDYMNYFNWCFNNVNESFIECGIKINNLDELSAFLFTYFKVNYFDGDSLFNINDIMGYWSEVFNDKNTFKSESDINYLVEVYKYFDKEINMNKVLQF